jgi:hypothetical protein
VNLNKIIFLKLTDVFIFIQQLGIALFYSTFYLLAVGVSADAGAIIYNGENLAAAAFFGILCFILNSIVAGYIILQWKQGIIYLLSSVETEERINGSQIVQKNENEEGYQN